MLRLLAEGRSDQEIAAALFIVRTTASEPVGSILAKLGLPFHAAAATHAVYHGLV